MSGESAIDGKIQLKVVAVFSKADSMHDDFVDGTSKSYDMTVFEAMEPAAYKGVRLRVANEHIPGIEPIRVEVGKKYRIEVSTRSLKNPRTFISPDNVRILSEL